MISQFSTANKTQRWFFLLRNGVMSGLSLATFIMEARDTSGALKQADFALKQGRQILIPASVLRKEGITWLVKYVQRGAQVVNRPSDVLKILADNDIFKMEDNCNSLSNKLDDVQRPNNSLNFNNMVEWLDLIVDIS